MKKFKDDLVWVKVSSDFAYSVRKILKFRDIRIADLAETLNISKEALTISLSGKRNLTLYSMCRIARGLDVELSVLMFPKE